MTNQSPATAPPAMPAPPDHHDVIDVVVVGGGAAGLSAGLTLARAGRSVTVVDAGRQRNAPASHMHGYLTRDGLPPGDLVTLGTAEVTRYGGHVIAGEVITARTTSAGFEVDLADGSSIHTRRLLLSSGIVDQLPDAPGLAERWGVDVLHCPYCHGHEVRDQHIVVLGDGPMAVHQALMWRQWSPHVTLLHDVSPAPDTAEAAQLSARGVATITGRLAGVDITNAALSGVLLADGSRINCAAVVVAPQWDLRTDLLDQLGVETTAMVVKGATLGPQVTAAPDGATSVAGVWAAGNLVDPGAPVITAAASGVRAAASLNADLVADDARRAVEAAVAAMAPEPAHRGHTHGSGHDDHWSGSADLPADPAEFWEDFYRPGHQPWSGRPNQLIVTELTDRPIRTPRKTALDLGCGSGADAIWLAQQGWTVTGVDISKAALDHAAEQAAAAGVADRIHWLRHDLNADILDGTWELVTATYLHSPVELHRSEILRRAAAAVAPGGTLLVIGHQGPPSWQPEPPAHVSFPTVDEIRTLLDGDGWTVERAESVTVELTAPDGEPATRPDNIVRLRRT
ncbi:FAD-dependent oxidoreductase [Phytoactinopolyspora limicola]|uniref:FAD-dependent oxidoreductase n=1 Tax=Phytoactinopolyspora limicola TaxID=2715536 RepID=UPI001A9C5205|nr:FAD-dependent oxidoreductase [Phytoactinopolyspora limicola]